MFFKSLYSYYQSKIILWLIVFLISLTTSAQTDEAIVYAEKTDTITVSNMSESNTMAHIAIKGNSLQVGASNPRKATLWALIPGGGQIYNWHHHDKWWASTLKLTVIYGGLGTFCYFIIQNSSDYKDFKNAYKWVSTNGASGKENQYTKGNYSANQLESYMDYYQSNVEWCSLFAVLLYGLQIVEATVTSHFLTFDVSDNLSLGIKPAMMPAVNNTVSFGIGFSLQYKH